MQAIITVDNDGTIKNHTEADVVQKNPGPGTYFANVETGEPGAPHKISSFGPVSGVVVMLAGTITSVGKPRGDNAVYSLCYTGRGANGKTETMFCDLLIKSTLKINEYLAAGKVVYAVGSLRVSDYNDKRRVSMFVGNIGFVKLPRATQDQSREPWDI